jgi:hypothetical protein
MLKPPLPLPLPIPRRDLPRPPDLILIDHQPLQPDRPARMDLVRADAHLRAEPEAHPVRHARRRVPEHARRVDARQELLRERRRRRQDRVRVVRAVRVDVRDGGRQRRHGLDRQHEREVLRVEVAAVALVGGLQDGGEGRGEVARERALAGGVAAEGDALREKRGGDGGEVGLEGRLLDEERLDAVAGGGVCGFGIDDDLDGHVQVGSVLEVYGA